MGYSSAELANRNVADITHPEDMAAERELLEQVLAGERTTYRMVKRYLRKDGSIFWGRLTATHVPEGIDGQDSAGVGMVEDISEQRAAEEALERDAAERWESAEQLQRTTQTLQTLIDASPLAIMTLDQQRQGSKLEPCSGGNVRLAGQRSHWHGSALRAARGHGCISRVTRAGVPGRSSYRSAGGAMPARRNAHRCPGVRCAHS